MTEDIGFEALKDSAFDFMRELIEYYGEEQGIQLWDAVSGALNPELKNAMMLDMLTGGRSGRFIHLTPVTGPNPNRIEQIKAIRQVTGFGLKEAKDISDALMNGTPQKIEISQTMRNAEGFSRRGIVRKLVSVGMNAS